MSRLVYVLNGPNLNLLGKRQPHIYGHETLADVERDCRKLAEELKLELRFHQSNREYEIIDWIHEARETAGGIVINPAAFTHTSVAIPRCVEHVRGAGHRVPHLERAQARGLPALFLCLAARRRRHRRLRHAGLPARFAARRQAHRREGCVRIAAMTPVKIAVMGAGLIGKRHASMSPAKSRPRSVPSSTHPRSARHWPSGWARAGIAALAI